MLEVKTVRVVGIVPIRVVGMLPDLVVEMIPDLVVEMIPDLADAVANTTTINMLVQVIDLTFFIVLLLVMRNIRGTWSA